jgi:hypothetical protein
MDKTTEKPEIPADDWYPAIAAAGFQPACSTADPASGVGLSGAGSFGGVLVSVRSAEVVPAAAAAGSRATVSDRGLGLLEPPRMAGSDLFGPASARPLKPPRRRVPWGGIVVTVGVPVLIGGIVAAVLLGPGRQPPNRGVGPSTAPTRPAALDPCVGLRGRVITGAGGPDTPTDLVAALEYAYYVKRDKDAVAALYAPGVLRDSEIDGPDGIGEFIGSIPADVTYCVTAGIVSDNRVNYEVGVVRPGAGAAATVAYRMYLTVTAHAPYRIQSLGQQ